MRVFILGVLSALSLSIPAAQAQQVTPLVIDGKPATIQGVGLGDGPAICKGKVAAEEFGLTIGKVYIPSMLLQWCQIGSRDDYSNITFDSTASKVVQVVRHLFVDTSKVSTQDFLASVERFYGPADFSDYRNRLIAYGDFETRGRRVELSDYGVGLVIDGATCGLSVDCPAAFNNYLHATFTLADQDAFAKAEADGKQAFKDRNANNANAISF